MNPSMTDAKNRGQSRPSLNALEVSIVFVLDKVLVAGNESII